MGFRSSSVSGGGITGFFGDRAFARSLMHIALPVTLQSMLRASFSIIDQVMIGQLGSASISGIGLGGKFASIHNVVLSAVTAAGAILISQYLGQGSRKNAARSYSVNLLVSLAIAAVFTLVSTRFAEPILGLYTQDDATRALGQTYLQTYAWSFFPAALSGMAETLLCCMEAAVFPLIASMTSLCINTGLNYLLRPRRAARTGGAGRGSSQRGCAGGVLLTCLPVFGRAAAAKAVAAAVHAGLHSAGTSYLRQNSAATAGQ